ATKEWRKEAPTTLRTVIRSMRKGPAWGREAALAHPESRPLPIPNPESLYSLFSIPSFRSTRPEQGRRPVATTAAAITIAATSAHGLMGFLAAGFQPVHALGLQARLIDTAAGGFLAAVEHEITVRIDFRFQFAYAQLDHDGVIEEADHRHAVRNDVLRI